MSPAPNEGPVATANAPTPPQRATTWERRSVGKAPSNRARDAGNMAAAPAPWIKRPAMRSAADGANPQRADPRLKTAKPEKNKRRLPSRSAVRPAVTRREPNTMLYPVMTHANAARES